MFINEIYIFGTLIKQCFLNYVTQVLILHKPDIVYDEKHILILKSLKCMFNDYIIFPCYSARY